jgi:protein-disulfide isomerase
VFKDFPLTNIHPQAVEAAQAVRCAGDQGAYLEMHDAIFSRQQEWSDRNPTELFVGMSGELALDEEDFRQCLESGKYESAVAADLQEGLELGISGTPTFFINGYPVVGAQPFTIFEQTITSLLQEQE